MEQLCYWTPHPLSDFSWKASEFTIKDPDGNAFSMSEQLGEKGLLIVFICNHCSYVKAITGRLAYDTQLLMDEGINVLAVMSNDYKLVASDSPENMKVFAQ